MVKDLILSMRSYRSFDPAVKLGTDQLRELVDHARFCPSSVNLQPLKFRLVNTEEEVAEVLGVIRWAGKIRDMVLPPVGHEPTAFIVICADKSVVPNADRYLIDVGITAEAILLAATEQGLGACMIGSFQKDTLPALLDLPDSLVPMLVLALGKPDEQVILTDPAEDGSVTYYRENGIHHVQKRRLDDLIVR